MGVGVGVGVGSCVGVGVDVGVGVGSCVGVGLGVCVGSWLVVGSWVVVGSLVVMSSLGVGVGSCMDIGSLVVGSWLGVGSSLGSFSFDIGMGVVSISCVAWLSLGSSWLDVLAHEARANAMIATMPNASALLNVCFIFSLPFVLLFCILLAFTLACKGLCHNATSFLYFFALIENNNSHYIAKIKKVVA